MQKNKADTRLLDVEEGILFFRDLPILPPFEIRLVNAGYQRAGKDYCWNSRGRRSMMVLHYTIFGQGVLEYEGQQFTYGPGDAMLVDLPSESVYRVDPDVGEWGFLFVSLSDQLAMQYARWLIDRVGHQFPLKFENGAVASILALIRDVQQGAVLGAVESTHRAFGFMTHLVSELTERMEPNPLPLNIQAVVTRCNNHFARSLSVDDLAQRSGLEKSYLIRQFKKYLGVTPRVYLESVRLKHAKAYLELTEMPIVEIAARCGFRDSNYFSQAFRTKEGVSPSEFRKRSISN